MLRERLKYVLGHQLAYPSQQETDYDRAARRANKIRERLGWKQGILNPKGWKKPKGMHWRTFERLNAEHDAFVDEALAGIDQQLDKLGKLTLKIGYIRVSQRMIISSGLSI
jgi:hypothetical protein